MRCFLLVALVAACDVRVPKESPELSLERMIDEPRVRAYEASSAFADGSGMRRPPDGTVTAATDIDPVRRSGLDHGAWTNEIPYPIGAALLARGRDRFEIVCATCHGVTGTGESIVAEKMAFRRPPSLHEPRTKAYPLGQLYAIVKDGYGLMPPFGATLTERDRWAVVAYLRSLWLSRAATVADLPADVRRDLEARAR